MSRRHQLPAAQRRLQPLRQPVWPQPPDGPRPATATTGQLHIQQQQQQLQHLPHHRAAQSLLSPWQTELEQIWNWIQLWFWVMIWVKVSYFVTLSFLVMTILWYDVQCFNTQINGFYRKLCRWSSIAKSQSKLKESWITHEHLKDNAWTMDWIDHQTQVSETKSTKLLKIRVHFVVCRWWSKLKTNAKVK